MRSVATAAAADGLVVGAAVHVLEVAVGFGGVDGLLVGVVAVVVRGRVGRRRLALDGSPRRGLRVGAQFGVGGRRLATVASLGLRDDPLLPLVDRRLLALRRYAVHLLVLAAHDVHSVVGLRGPRRALQRFG